MLGLASTIGGSVGAISYCSEREDAYAEGGFRGAGDELASAEFIEAIEWAFHDVTGLGLRVKRVRSGTE
jgi:hypothetical protein